MERKTQFTALQWLVITQLVAGLEDAMRADPPDYDREKHLRNGIRGMGLFISDFRTGGKPNTGVDLEVLQKLLDSGAVRIVG